MKLPPSMQGVLLTILLTTSSSALSSITFYSEERDAQTQATKDAWAKVDLNAVVQVPRSNLSKLLSEQLAAVSDSSHARQKALVQMIATSNARQVGIDGTDGQTLFGQLDVILDRHAIAACAKGSCVTTIEGRTAWRGLLLKAATAQSQMEALESRRKRVGKATSCTTPSDDDVKKRCAALAEANMSLKTFNPHLGWVKAQEAADDASQKLADAQKSADELKAAITADLKIASENAESRDGQMVAKVAEAAQRLKSNLDKLIALQKKDVFHFELMSQVKQDAANAFLTTLSNSKDGTPPPATSPKAAMAVVLFAQFFDNTSAKLKQTEEAGIAPIVLEKEVARLQQESALADIAVRKARATLLQQRASVLRNQFDLLVQAEDARGALPPAIGNALVEDALLNTKKKKVDDDQRQALWLALGHYLRLDATQSTVATIDLKLSATDHMAELAYTEANIHAWKSLIDAHINQLTAWSKAGIKGSDITSTLNSIAAWWIAFGVNK